jgi:large subunit ribosomal protein L24
MSYLKKDDPVIVLSGNNKGLKGQILRVLGDKVIVQGVNVRKRHVKPTQQNPKGSIVQVEKPINASNVALEVGGTPVRLRTRRTDTGAKEIYYKEGDKEVVYRTLKKGR